MTFAEELEALIGNEQVEGVRLISGRDYIDDLVFPKILLTWEQARSYLNYLAPRSYSENFSRDCHSLYIWTPTRVIFIRKYAGYIQPEIVPRNP
jgi:hypothetical protein